MARPVKKDTTDKFQRYRASRKARHQAALLRGAPEEREAPAFIEAEADWSE